MATKTFKEILEIDSIVAKLYAKQPELKDGKFGYAYKRYYAKNYTPLTEEYKNEVETLKINNALENPQNKALIVDPQSKTGFATSKEGLLKFNADLIKLDKEYETKEVEIIPFISPTIPEGLSDEEKELLTGVVI